MAKDILSEYLDPSILAPYADVGLNEKLKRLRTTPTSVPQVAPIDFSALPVGKGKKDDKSTLSSIIDILTAGGGAVTNTLANLTDAELNRYDVPFLESAEQFGQGFKESFTENPLGILVGAPVWKGLETVGEKSKRAEDVFTNLFGEQQAADQPYTAGSFFKGQKGALDLRDIGEFAADVVLDPLTYVTFGAGSAIKAGTKAAQQTAKNVAKEQGVTLGKMKDVYTEAPEQIQKQLISRGVSTEDAVKIAKKASQDITNAAKTARAKAQNAIISLDVPFTNLTKQFGNKANIPLVGDWLTINKRPIGDEGAKQLMGLFSRLNLQPEQKAFILQKFGLDIPEDIPITDDILETFAKTLSTDAYRELTARLAKAGVKETDQTLLQRLTREIGGTSAAKELEDILSTLPPTATVDDALNALKNATIQVERIAGVSPQLVKSAGVFRQLTKLADDTDVTFDDLFAQIQNLRAQGFTDDAIAKTFDDLVAQKLPLAIQKTGTIADRSFARGVGEALDQAGQTKDAGLNLIDQLAYYLGQGIQPQVPKPAPKPPKPEPPTPTPAPPKTGLTAKEQKKLDAYNARVASGNPSDMLDPDEMEEYRKLLAKAGQQLPAPAPASAPKPAPAPAPYIPFTQGENFYAAPTVPKELRDITEQWKKVFGIDKDLILVNVGEGRKSTQELIKIIKEIEAGIANGTIANTRRYNEIVNVLKDMDRSFGKRTLGMFHSSGVVDDFVVVVYRTRPKKQDMLSTLAHELGHATMETAYLKAAPDVQKAIDDVYNRWYASVKGKPAQAVESVASYFRLKKLGLVKDPELAKGYSQDYLDYLLMKEEWFAEQVAKWALSNEKPLSVVEKFFAKLARVMKSFFQQNKKYLAEKTMEDWLNSLSKIDVPTSTDRVFVSTAEASAFRKANQNFIEYFGKSADGKKTSIFTDPNSLTVEKAKELYDQLTKTITELKNRKSAYEARKAKLPTDLVERITTLTKSIAKLNKIAPQKPKTLLDQIDRDVLPVSDQLKMLNDVGDVIDNTPATGVKIPSRKITPESLEDVLRAVSTGDTQKVADFLTEYPSKMVNTALRKMVADIEKNLGDVKKYEKKGRGFGDQKIPYKQFKQDQKAFGEIVNRLRDDQSAVRKAAKLRNDAVDFAIKHLEKIGKGNMKPIISKDIEPAFEGLEFVDDMGGQSRLGKFLGEKVFKYFNTRTLGSETDFVNWISNRIQDADLKRYSNAKRIEGELGRIQSLTRGMREDEVTAVQYVLEGKFPKGLTKEQFLQGMDVVKVEALAESIRKFLDDLGRGDLKAQVLGKLRSEYFPHTRKIKPEDVKGYRTAFPDQASLFGRRATMSAAMERKQFQTFADVDDALNEMTDRLNALEYGSKEYNELKQQIDELANLFERDTLQALASRAYQSVRARAMRELFEQLEMDGMITLVPQKQGYRALNRSELEQLGLTSILKSDENASIVRALDDANRIEELETKVLAGLANKADLEKVKGTAKTVYVREEVLDALLKLDRMFTDEGLNKFVGTLNDAMNVWKYAVTVLIPRHYINNFIGNVFNNGIVGVDKQAYKQSADLLVKFSKRPDDLTDVEKEIIAEAYDRGVIGQGFTADFVRDNPFAVPENKAQALAQKMEKTAYVRMARKVGELTDDYTRMALFLYTKRITGSYDIAANTVRKFLFNYHELTQADKFVRATMMPFWTWMKNNIPLQLQQILQQPRYYAAISNLRDATFDDSEDYPTYVKEGYINWHSLGGIRPLSIPMSDVNLPFDPVRTFVTSLNPFVKAPFELTANKYFFTGAPIDVEAFKTRSNDFSAQAYYEYLLRNSGGLGQAFLSAFPVDENKEGKQVGDVITALFFGKPYEEK